MKESNFKLFDNIGKLGGKYCNFSIGRVNCLKTWRMNSGLAYWKGPDTFLKTKWKFAKRKSRIVLWGVFYAKLQLPTTPTPPSQEELYYSGPQPTLSNHHWLNSCIHTEIVSIQRSLTTSTTRKTSKIKWRFLNLTSSQPKLSVWEGKMYT